MSKSACRTWSRLDRHRHDRPDPGFRTRRWVPTGLVRPGRRTAGDTGPNDALVQLARGADLLLSEAALEDNDPHNPGDLHLTPADVGEQAKKAGVKRLVITHVPPWYNRETQAENARRTYPGPVEIATPHAVFDI